MESIETNLRRYGLWRLEWEERIVPVTGDLEEPLFGMADEGFDALAKEVDLIIHAAAVVNLVYPYSALKAANVGGTREVLRLACRHGAKPMHHVSTNGIFPPGNGLCEEETDLEELAEAREDGYRQSKWVAERLVREALGRGLPVCVYPARPDRRGHRRVFTARIRPEVGGWYMEMTPVDFVAVAILHLASDQAAQGGTYHLANPDPPPAGEVFGRLEEQGYPLERLTYDEWLQKIDAAPPEEGSPGEVLRGASPSAEELWEQIIYEDRNARRALNDGPTRPAIDGALMDTYARYFAQQGWIGAPAALQETRRRG
jgi:nucleoside-diphosphate-sugar epimerase